MVMRQAALVSDKTKRVRGVYARRAIQIDDLYLLPLPLQRMRAGLMDTEAWQVHLPSKSSCGRLQGRRGEVEPLGQCRQKWTRGREGQFWPIFCGRPLQMIPS